MITLLNGIDVVDLRVLIIFFSSLSLMFVKKKTQVHSVAISEFPKWQTMFYMQKFKYI